LKTVAKGLKQELACGGTVKDNLIELQGDHLKNAKKALSDLDFPKKLWKLCKANKKQYGESTHIETKYKKWKKTTETKAKKVKTEKIVDTKKMKMH